MSPDPGPPRRPPDAGDTHDLQAGGDPIGRDPIDLHPLASALAEGASPRLSDADTNPTAERAREAPNPPPSLGVLLRETRRRRALTLLDVSQATRINPAYLEALEAEDWQVLPAPVYVRGFARSYGRFLGLDPDLVRGLIPHDLPRPPELEPAAGLRRSRADHVQISLPPLRPRPLGLAAGAILLGALAVFGMFRLLPDGTGDGSPAAVATAPTGMEGTAAGPPANPSGAPSTPEVAVTSAPATSTPEAQATTPAATSAATAVVPAVATVPPFEDGRMPDFTGVIRGEAEQVLDDLRLAFVVIEVANAAPAGIVFDQAPAPGESAPDGASVTLIVSQGPPPG